MCACVCVCAFVCHVTSRPHHVHFLFFSFPHNACNIGAPLSTTHSLPPPTFRDARTGAKRTVLGKKGKGAVSGAMSSADAIEEEGLHLDDTYEGPLGEMRRNWDEFSAALNCYGAVTAARDSCAPGSSSTGQGGGRKSRGSCDPGIWS